MHLDSYSDLRPSQPDSINSESLFFDEHAYFDTLLSDIEQATQDIILETYIFTLDTIGERILKALQRAAQRGVYVKLLIDGVGSKNDAEIIASSLEQAKSEIRIYHPLPWKFSSYRWALKHENTLTKLWRFIIGINNRDHRKLCIIDGRIAWLGSFNITQSRELAHIGHRHETAARITGVAVMELKQNFFHVWQQKNKGYRKRLLRFLSNHSLKYRKQKNGEMIKKINSARDRIWITNAYFSPSGTLISAFKKAVARGVDVQIIMPSHSDMFFFPMLTRTFYADLLAANLRIYEYVEGILHSKTMLIDDELIVGSTNLNCRSYFHDLELDVILTKPNTIELMSDKFTYDKHHCEEITLHTMKRFSTLLNAFGWVSRLLRYWL